MAGMPTGVPGDPGPAAGAAAPEGGLGPTVTVRPLRELRRQVWRQVAEVDKSLACLRGGERRARER